MFLWDSFANAIFVLGNVKMTESDVVHSSDHDAHKKKCTYQRQI